MEDGGGRDCMHRFSTEQQVLELQHKPAAYNHQIQELQQEETYLLGDQP